MRGVAVLCWLYVRRPYPMLCVWVYRGLCCVDTEVAVWWFRVSGMYASARRCEAALRKIGSA